MCQLQGNKLFFHEFKGLERIKKVEKGQGKKKQTKMCYYKKWTPEENQVYIQYLHKYSQELSCEQNRRKLKTFKKMSEIMNCQKSAQQCRGHHKKMVEKYQTIDLIIEAVQKKNLDLRARQIIKQPTKYKKIQFLDSLSSQQSISQIRQIDESQKLLIRDLQCDRINSSQMHNSEQCYAEEEQEQWHKWIDI